MKRVLLVLCCAALCAAPALAKKKAAGAATTMTDQQFVNFAAQTDMVEANLGKLAQDVGAKQAVKDYGHMLATDHTNDYQQLQSTAQQAGFTVPGAINAENNKKLIGPFHQLKGAQFDHKYIQTMIEGHTKALAVYKKEANDAQNAAIKSYAQQVIPVLEKHLDDAKAIAAGKTPTNTD